MGAALFLRRRAGRGGRRRAVILPRQGRKGNVKGGGDRAEEFVFFDVNFAVGGDDGGRGDEEALFDGRAGGGEFVEREVESGEIDGRRGGVEATVEKFELRGAGGERGGGVAGAGVGEHGEDGGDLGRDGLEGVDLGDRGRGGAGGGDVTQKKLLQGELERGDAGVGVDELIEQFEKRCEDGGPQGF